MEKIGAKLLRVAMLSSKDGVVQGFKIDQHYNQLATAINVRHTNISTPFNAIKNIDFRVELEEIMNKHKFAVSYSTGGNIICSNNSMIIHIPISNDLEYFIKNFTYYSLSESPALFSFHNTKMNTISGICADNLYLWNPSVVSYKNNMNLIQGLFHSGSDHESYNMMAKISVEDEDIEFTNNFKPNNFYIPEYSTKIMTDLQSYANKSLSGLPVFVMPLVSSCNVKDAEKMAKIVDFLKGFYKRISI